MADINDKDMLKVMLPKMIGRPIAPSEAAMVDVWIGEWEFDSDMVEYAIEQTVLRRINSNILFKYADTILRYWKENNVKTLEEGKAYDEAQRKKATSSRQKAEYRIEKPVEYVILKRDPSFVKYNLVELKPCPFCGSTEIGVRNQMSTRFKAFYTLVECSVCGANTRTSMNTTEADPYDKAFWESDSVQEVAKLWNMRI